MKGTRARFILPRHVLYAALGLMVGCSEQPTMPGDVAAPEFTKVTITDPTRVLTVGVDAPKNLTLKGTVAGIVVVVDNAIVDLSKATVDCSGQTTADPKIGVWLRNNRTHVHIKGGGTGVIRNCGTGVLIGPPTPGSGELGGSNNHVDGLVIEDNSGWAIVASNSHDNLINSNTLVSPNGLSVIGNDPRPSVSGKNRIYDNTVTAGARFSIYASSDGNIIRGNVMRGEAVDAAIAVDRDANIISDNQTEVGPEGDDPMVGIQVLSGADDNTITKNHVGAGDFGVLVEANTFRNTIRGNTAIARSGQDAVDESGNCVNNSWTKNTFRRSDPPCIVGITLDAVTFTSPTTIQLEGPGATFNSAITNRATKLTGFSIRSWIEQGVSRRLGGISPLHCTATLGGLPRGACTQVGDMVIASNTAAGHGTLVAGGATVIVELIRLVGGDTVVVDPRSVPISLTFPSSIWTERAALLDPSSSGAAAAAGGEIYCAGGVGMWSPSAQLAVYDGSVDQWTSRASLPQPRFETAGLIALDGRLFLAGGRGEFLGRVTSSLFIYDIATNTWTSGAPMPTPGGCGRGDVMAGQIYVFSGCPNDDYGASTLYRYDPATDAWTELPRPPHPHVFPAVGAVGGLLVVAGGFDGGANVTGFVDGFDPATGQWQSLAPMATARVLAASTVARGQLYTIGGWAQGSELASGEVFNPTSNAWSALPPYPTARAWSAAATLEDAIFVMGGSGLSSDVYALGLPAGFLR